MKNALLVVVLLFSALASAGSDSNPADYTINVHVSSARAKGGSITLKVTIDGKKYELEGPGQLLLPGDYKAKLLKDEHKNPYEIYQMHQFLFPDKKTRWYVLVGVQE
jgi:hypothetical protein